MEAFGERASDESLVSFFFEHVFVDDVVRVAFGDLDFLHELVVFDVVVSVVDEVFHVVVFVFGSPLFSHRCVFSLFFQLVDPRDAVGLRFVELFDLFVQVRVLSH